MARAWPLDPCPTCGMEPGKYCVTSSGRRRYRPHKGRESAFRTGLLKIIECGTYRAEVVGVTGHDAEEGAYVELRMPREDARRLVSQTLYQSIEFTPLVACIMTPCMDEQEEQT